MIPTEMSVLSSESLTKEIRSPHVCPSARVFHTSSVQVSHSQREEFGVGETGASVGDDCWTGAGVGETSPTVNTVFVPYVL